MDRDVGDRRKPEPTQTASTAASFEQNGQGKGTKGSRPAKATHKRTGSESLATAPTGLKDSQSTKPSPKSSGWSTSMAERLRTTSSGTSGGGSSKHPARPADGGQGGSDGRHSAQDSGGGSVKSEGDGIGGKQARVPNGHRVGTDEAEAAAAIAALAGFAAMQPPAPSSSSKNTRDGKTKKRPPPAAPAAAGTDASRKKPPPPPPSNIKAGNGDGAATTATRKADNHSGTNGGKSKPAERGRDYDDKAPKAASVHKRVEREEVEGAEGADLKRKATGPGQRPKKKGKVNARERSLSDAASESPNPRETDAEVLPSVEAAVPEAGGDLSNPPAVNPFPHWEEDSEEMVGSKVRVYWDGDNEWYAGRIVRFKAKRSKPYLVRYDEDGSVEWMDLPKEPAIVARQVVWVKMRSHPWWPAQVYQPSGKAAMKDGMIEVKERHAFVVFFKTDESGFVPVGQNAIHSFHSRPDLLNPSKKPSKGLEKAISAAKEELVAMAEAAEETSKESYANEDRERAPEPAPIPAEKKPKLKDIAPKRNRGEITNRTKKGAEKVKRADGNSMVKPRKGATSIKARSDDHHPPPKDATSPVIATVSVMGGANEKGSKPTPKGKDRVLPPAVEKFGLSRSPVERALPAGLAKKPPKAKPRTDGVLTKDTARDNDKSLIPKVTVSKNQEATAKERLPAPLGLFARARQEGFRPKEGFPEREGVPSGHRKRDGESAAAVKEGIAAKGTPAAGGLQPAKKPPRPKKEGAAPRKPRKKVQKPAGTAHNPNTPAPAARPGFPGRSASSSLSVRPPPRDDTAGVRMAPGWSKAFTGIDGVGGVGGVGGAAARATSERHQTSGARPFASTAGAAPMSFANVAHVTAAAAAGQGGGLPLRLPLPLPLPPPPISTGVDKAEEFAEDARDDARPPSSVASARTWRSGSFASDDCTSTVHMGDSEDGGSAADSVSGSLAGGDTTDGDTVGSGSGRIVHRTSPGGRGRTRGRGAGRGIRAGRGARSTRGGSGSRRGRKATEGGKGKPKAHEGFGLVGKTIKLHRDDVDYPNGRWCVADVRQWSRSQRKYLLSYRGRGSAWLPPGWLELKEKRKAQVVTVAPAESSSALLPFAGHIPGVGSRSSTRCYPLDFLEIAPVVASSKSQAAADSPGKSVAAADGCAAGGGSVKAPDESLAGSSPPAAREANGDKATALGALGVLAAAGETAAAAVAASAGSSDRTSPIDTASSDAAADDGAVSSSGAQSTPALAKTDDHDQGGSSNDAGSSSGKVLEGAAAAGESQRSAATETGGLGRHPNKAGEGEEQSQGPGLPKTPPCRESATASGAAPSEEQPQQQQKPAQDSAALAGNKCLHHSLASDQKVSSGSSTEATEQLPAAAEGSGLDSDDATLAKPTRGDVEAREDRAASESGNGPAEDVARSPGTARTSAAKTGGGAAAVAGAGGGDVKGGLSLSARAQSADAPSSTIVQTVAESRVGGVLKEPTPREGSDPATHSGASGGPPLKPVSERKPDDASVMDNEKTKDTPAVTDADAARTAGECGASSKGGASRARTDTIAPAKAKEEPVPAAAEEARGTAAPSPAPREAAPAEGDVEMTDAAPATSQAVTQDDADVTMADVKPAASTGTAGSAISSERRARQAPEGSSEAAGEGKEGDVVGAARSKMIAAKGSSARAAARAVVAPRGLVRRDGDTGAACNMCRSKWDRDQTLVCCECLMHYHPGCLDPPMTPKELATYGQGQQTWCCDYCQKCVGCGKGNEDALQKEGTPLTCTERGKVHHAHIDAPEGSEPGPRASEKMWLCGRCEQKYKSRSYCPKCGVTYEEDDNTVKAVGCSACEFWVHAACEGLSTEEYQLMVEGKDTKFGGEYLCPVCRDRAMAHMLGELQRADVVGMFAQPVTTAIAANYFHIVKEPMDLKTMGEKVRSGQYKTLQEMRDDCELMSKNALLFNRAPGEYHNRARNYFKITQIAWDSLRAQPASVAPITAPNVTAESLSAAESASRTKTANKRGRVTPKPGTPAAAAAAAAALVPASPSPSPSGLAGPTTSSSTIPTPPVSKLPAPASALATTLVLPTTIATATTSSALGAAGVAAPGPPGTSATTTLPASNAAPTNKSNPYQTKPGKHAQAVHEQQLLSRPKPVRAVGTGVRKDLLTGTTQPIKLRPLAENPDPSPLSGLGKLPTVCWVSRPHSFMTDWLDVCLYCGSAGWEQQDAFMRNNAVAAAAAAAAACAGSGTTGDDPTIPAAEKRTKEGGADRTACNCKAGELAEKPPQEQLQQQQPQKAQLPLQQLSTRLFCADCGECFHSWCTAAPVRTMDARAAAAWRCPNCKVCEVCTESQTTDDELLVFCDLCDRAYHTYCLTPAPLKPPEGLWVCGQCVSCSTCGVPQVYTSWSCTREQCQSCVLEERRKLGREEVAARKATLSAELRTRRALHREAAARIGNARDRALTRSLSLGDRGAGGGGSGGQRAGKPAEDDGQSRSEQEVSKLEAAEMSAAGRAAKALATPLHGAKRWGRGSVASEYEGKCPVCKKKGEAHEERTLECDACKLWIHDKCDAAAAAVLDNPELEFFCRVCLGQDEVDARGVRLDVPLPLPTAAEEAASAAAAAERALEAAESAASAAVEERRRLKDRAAEAAAKAAEVATKAATAASSAAREAEARDTAAAAESAGAAKAAREAREKVVQLEDADRRASGAGASGGWGEHGDGPNGVSTEDWGERVRLTHLGRSEAATKLCRRVAGIQARRKTVVDVRDQERWRRKRDERQWHVWEELRPQYQAVMDMALDRVNQLRAPDKQEGIATMVASTSSEQAKVPYWLRARAARFVRMQRYRYGERFRAQRRADRALGVQPHISHLVGWVVSAAAFLAVSGVELTLPWPDEFTKQMALQPPCFLLDASSGAVANGSDGTAPTPSTYSDSRAFRPRGPLLFHPPRKHDGPDRSPNRPGDLGSPSPSAVATAAAAVAQSVSGTQLDAEYEAQLEMFRRRQQQGLVNGGAGSAFPGDCRPLSPVQDSPRSSLDEMDVEGGMHSVKTFSAAAAAYASSHAPGSAVPSAQPHASTQAAHTQQPEGTASTNSHPSHHGQPPAPTPHFGVAALRAMSEAKRLEAEACAAVEAAQVKAKRERRALEAARTAAGTATQEAAAANGRAQAAKQAAEIAKQPFQPNVTSGTGPKQATKKKRRRKSTPEPAPAPAPAPPPPPRPPPPAAPAAPVMPTPGPQAGPVPRSGLMETRPGTTSIVDANKPNEASAVKDRDRSCDGGAKTAFVAGGVQAEGNAAAGVQKIGGAAVSAADDKDASTTTGMEVDSESLSDVQRRPQPQLSAKSLSQPQPTAEMLKTKPLQGWGKDVEAELGPWEDVRACCLCKYVGDGSETGRLLPLEDGTWVHTHCGLWSSEVYEKPQEAWGQIRELYKARGRGRLLECTLCKEIGATVDCKVGKCDEVYHFQCAMDAGCVFMVDKTLACPLHRQEGLEDADGNTSSRVGPSADEAATATGSHAPPQARAGSLPAGQEQQQPVAVGTTGATGAGAAASSTPSSGSASSAAVSTPAGAGASSAAPPAPESVHSGTASATKVAAVLAPQKTQSRMQLVQDIPRYLEAVRGPNKGKMPSWEDHCTLRVGAVSIQKLGRLALETPGSHSSTHIYPVGFRSSRIFWSRRRPLRRTLYVCEILDGSKLAKHQLHNADTVLGGTRPKRRPPPTDEVEKETPQGPKRKRPRPSTPVTGASGRGATPAGGGKAKARAGSGEGTEAAAESEPSEEAARSTQAGDGTAILDGKGKAGEADAKAGPGGRHRPPNPKEDKWWGDRWDDNGHFLGVVFRATAMDDPQRTMIDSDLERLYERIVDAVDRGLTPLRAGNSCFLRRRTSRASFGLNGAQFFGLGYDAVRTALEAWPDAVGAAVSPEDDPDSQYRFVMNLPSEETVVAWQRRQAAKKAGVKENPNGCARAEILSESSSTARTGRITRTLVRAAEKLGTVDAPDSGGSNGGSGALGRLASQQTQQAQYRQLKALPTGHGLKVRRSHIHGWGLFACEEFQKDTMLVEYMGEVVRQCVADLREIKYEEMGVGSCYLFRADADAIVDATRKGNLARFINHCCDPNAIARIVNLDASTKKIIIVAKRNIKPGEEITYDYKFEREDGQLPCHCGASVCYGSMN